MLWANGRASPRTANFLTRPQACPSTPGHWAESWCPPTNCTEIVRPTSCTPQSGDSSELAPRLPCKGRSVRNRGVSQTMPFLVIPRSLLRGGFIVSKFAMVSVVQIPPVTCTASQACRNSRLPCAESRYRYLSQKTPQHLRSECVAHERAPKMTQARRAG